MGGAQSVRPYATTLYAYMPTSLIRTGYDTHGFVIEKRKKKKVECQSVPLKVTMKGWILKVIESEKLSFVCYDLLKNQLKNSCG